MRKFKLNDAVRKIKGSRWQGKVVGTYSTALTPEGYAVESSTEWGSVQIYPAAALELVTEAPEIIEESPPIGEIAYVSPEALMLLERGRWAEGLPSTLALVVAMMVAVAGLLATITYAIWRVW